jgi:hypothetical protein
MTDPDPAPRRGYLLLADISGYTAFLTGTELEHAQAIIRELTKLIRQRLTPPMRFVKLEGDAVFCYAGCETFANGERFIESIGSSSRRGCSAVGSPAESRMSAVRISSAVLWRAQPSSVVPSVSSGSCSRTS